MGLSNFDMTILKPITLNGTADQNLFNCIKWFQSISSFGGSSAAQDGVVSPAPSRNYRGSRSTVVFSIAKMNNASPCAEPTCQPMATSPPSYKRAEKQPRVAAQPPLAHSWGL